MQLSSKAIQEFKRIYRAEYGVELSDDEAREMGTRVVRVFMAILKTSGPPPSPPPSPSAD